jgi:hypothetical protein
MCLPLDLLRSFHLIRPLRADIEKMRKTNNELRCQDLKPLL